MSLNNEERMMSTSDKLVQAPRLQSGGVGYGAWKDNMHVHLQRAGAEGIHCIVMLESDWETMTTNKEKWAAAELASALALVTGNATTSSSDSSSTKTDSTDASTKVPVSVTLSEEFKAARKLVTATVERSRKTFGIVYSSLPDELRPQIAHIPNGFACDCQC